MKIRICRKCGARIVEGAPDCDCERNPDVHERPIKLFGERDPIRREAKMILMVTLIPLFVSEACFFVYWLITENYFSATIVGFRAFIEGCVCLAMIGGSRGARMLFVVYLGFGIMSGALFIAWSGHLMLVVMIVYMIVVFDIIVLNRTVRSLFSDKRGKLEPAASTQTAMLLPAALVASAALVFFTNAPKSFRWDGGVSDSVSEVEKLRESGYKSVVLVGADFAGMEFEGTDFSYSDFRVANFANAKLKGADFSLSNLCEAKLMGADLSEAKCVRTEFIRADLSGANCQGSRFHGSGFSGTKFSGADFRRADFGAVPLSDPVLEGVAINKGARLDGDKLAPAKFFYAEFTGTDLREANLSGVDLTGTSLENANLEGADMRNANLDEVKLSGARLAGAKLGGAVNVEQDQFKEVYWSDQTEWPQGITPPADQNLYLKTAEK